MRHTYSLFFTFVVVVLPGGCSTYYSKPLPTEINLIHNIDQAVSSGILHKSKSKKEPDHAEASALRRKSILSKLCRPAKKWSLDEISAMAVRNNPDLKAQRRQLGVAQAQLYSVRLFPDPQLSASLDHPVVNTMGTVNALSMDLGYDILPLINRGPRIDSEKQSLIQTRLQILWQEWQVSERARSLAVRLVGQRRQLKLLQKMNALYLKR